MSLLSEIVATTNDSSDIVATQSLVLVPDALPFLTLSNGVYQQAQGYAAVRDQKWTPVLDVSTDQPLKLPQGYVPTGIFIKAVQNLPGVPRLTFYYLDSDEDPDNANSIAIITLIGTSEMNPGVWRRVDENTSGEDYLGYNYLFIENLDYPTPVASGVLQVTVSYF